MYVVEGLRRLASGNTKARHRLLLGAIHLFTRGFVCDQTPPPPHY